MRHDCQIDDDTVPGCSITLSHFNACFPCRFANHPPALLLTSGGRTQVRCGFHSALIQTFKLLSSLLNFGVRPLASGYLPRLYHDYRAGGRRFAHSKHTKPGIRPIGIVDVICRILSRGLHRRTRKAFYTSFQTSSANVLQFGGRTPNGATNMYHLLSPINAQAEAQPSSTSQASLDPIMTLCRVCQCLQLHYRTNPQNVAQRHRCPCHPT